MTSLLDLPEEIQVWILSQLDATSLCSVALTCHHLHRLTNEEEVWIALAMRLYQVDLHVSDSFSPRQFYKAWLHGLGPLLGLWQRTDLRYYSGLVRLTYRAQAIVIEEVKASDCIFETLIIEPVLIARADRDREAMIEKHGAYLHWHGRVGILYEERSLIPRDQLAAASKKEGGLKRLLYNFFTSEPTTVGEKEGIMRIEVAEEKEDKLHEAFEIYLRRELEVVHSQLEEEEEYLELQRRRYRETLYSLCQAWYRRLPLLPTPDQYSEGQKPITPGLFVGQYSVHGSEFVRVEVTGGAYLRGTKVTGDPNVPFDQISFEVTSSECFDISLENQRSCDLLLRNTAAVTKAIAYEDDLQLGFKIPDDCHRESDCGTETFLLEQKTCQGRWAAKCQVAGDNFDQPSMIDGNLVKFSDNVFAVIFLQLYSLALFRRVTEI